ncbi:hypothetical protein RB195_024953 [Necator americanus]|uniref:Uncharacterized protein n=1 Tax=Necator americanus TaxID=51031 RepID=A0ABR1EQI0_NECAM
MEQIEDESQLQIATAVANDLIFMLTARFDENSCILDRMSAKLGYTTRCTRGENQNSDEVGTQNTQNDYGEQNSNHNESEPSTSQSGLPDSIDSVQNQTEQFRYRSIKPPQASLPKFHGDAEDFAEYWAIFETLVHKSKELDVIEKILLLKESLRGRAQIAIKDIKLIPENYDWIIKTLQETYCN